MKRLFTLMICCAAFLGCTKDDDAAMAEEETYFCGTPYLYSNSLTLLKINFVDYAFEGAFHFSSLLKDTVPNDTIPLLINYQPPGDFGNLALHHATDSTLIFDGSIVWTGLGQLNFPNSFVPASSFGTNATPQAQPADSLITLYAEPAWEEVNRPIEYTSIWNSVKHSTALPFINNDTKFGLFVYTPSVGIGTPSDWDYFLLIYNTGNFVNSH